MTLSVNYSINRVRALTIQSVSSLYPLILWAHLNFQNRTMTFVFSDKPVLWFGGEIAPQVHISEHLVPIWHAFGKLVEPLGGGASLKNGPWREALEISYHSPTSAHSVLDSANKVTGGPPPPLSPRRPPLPLPSLPLPNGIITLHPSLLELLGICSMTVRGKVAKEHEVSVGALLSSSSHLGEDVGAQGVGARCPGTLGHKHCHPQV